MATEVELAYEYCRRISKRRAKNFYYAFRTLPARKRRAIYAVYAFCRYCDDVADEDLPLGERTRLLSELRQSLAQCRSGRPDGPLFVALHHASGAFGVPYEYYETVIDGVEMDLTVTRYESFDELNDYCYKVASVIGLICIEIAGYTDQRAREYAADLGVAMQLTNILRDVREDAERERIYLPMNDLRAHGYSEAELKGAAYNDAFRSLMKFESDRARRYFERGRRLFPLLAGEARVFPMVLHGIYSAVLDRIEQRGFDVFAERVGLSTQEKLAITAKLWLAYGLPPLLRPSRRRR